MNFDFFAFINRMKYIKRWSLMHSVVEENIMEHSYQVTIIAHLLALIKNKHFNGNVDVNKVVLYATYHETSEVITGDLPTPIKYYNKEINSAYKDLEVKACKKLLEMLPEELQNDYEQAILPDTNSYEYTLAKCADRLSAYIKCIEELKLGNVEFKKAKQIIEDDIKSKNLPEVNYFLLNVVPSYEKTLDELDE